MNTETNELLNPSFRKGWAGNMQICYPNHTIGNVLPHTKTINHTCPLSIEQDDM